MAAAKGNQNAKGNKGGGRKSAYQEAQDASFLWDIFLNEYSVEDIKDKLKKGKFSVKDVWISKLVGGNERMLGMLVQKLFPDKILEESNVKGKIEVIYNDPTKDGPSKTDE